MSLLGSPKKIKVLIVDDSSVIRMLLSRILARDPEIEVVGVAPDPYVAREKIVVHEPDVMTLDIEMPKMDGLTFLEAVMKHHPVRTVIVSSLTEKNSSLALRALELGAIDVITKPAIDVADSINAIAEKLIDHVKAAARARVRQVLVKPKKVEPSSLGTSLDRTTHQLLAIAASTGGTEALKELLPELPADLPGTLIVQHMPPVFTKAFAASLQKLCPFEVREAQDGDRVLPGVALLAPGNFHMEIERSGAYYYVKLHQRPALHGVRPAADYLMQSVAKYAGKNAIGLVLTGMGRDGAEGLLQMRRAGGFNIAQDEASSVVFGMPKEAIRLEAIDKILPLERISKELIEQFRNRVVGSKQ